MLPMGQLIKLRAYPDVDDHGAAAPNADTLYTMVWLDVPEPWVFSMPDIGNRFYIMPLLSAFQRGVLRGRLSGHRRCQFGVP